MRKGQKVRIKIGMIQGAKQLVPNDYPESIEERDFTILLTPRKNNIHYMILIDDDLAGWKIGIFHTTFLEIEPKHLGKKFFDVDTTYFVI